MISNANDLNVALEQLGHFADTLEAMRQHAENTNSRVFPVLSQVYIHRIRELNAEIRAYLQSHQEAEDVLQNASPHASPYG